MSHVQERGVARSACVAHWARHGLLLGGCVSFAMFMARKDGYATGDNAVEMFLDTLKSANEQHYLNITYTDALRQRMNQKGFSGF